MKYVNAADVLPQELLMEVSKYFGGKLLYVPTSGEKSSWGEKNGSKQYYFDRNRKMKELFQEGKTLDELSEMYGLSSETIRKIVR